MKKNGILALPPRARLEDGYRLLCQMQKIGEPIDSLVLDGTKAAIIAMGQVEHRDFDPEFTLNEDADPILDFPRTREGFISWINEQLLKWISVSYPNHEAFEALKTMFGYVRVQTKDQSDAWNEIDKVLCGISYEMSDRRKGRAEIPPATVQNTIHCFKEALFTGAPLFCRRTGIENHWEVK